MLQENAVVGSVQAFKILGISTMHFLGIIQVFTEIGTDNILVPHLET